MFAGNQSEKADLLFQFPMNLFANTEGLDYKLIDSGDGRKLEQFGAYLLDRPEIEAMGSKKLPEKWVEADYRFEQKSANDGIWHFSKNLPESWLIEYRIGSQSLKFKLELSKFKHIGLFPEQAENWRFIHDFIIENESSKILNLFAYTSAASIVAAAFGAEVTNVEALKQLSLWAKENASLNQIDNVRWLVDDARTYLKRAIRRKEKYHGIILDPPAFGHGSKGKRWILEKHFEDLIEDVVTLLDPKNSFVIINTYSPKMPARMLREILQRHFSKNAKISISDLYLKANSSSSFKTGILTRIKQP